MTWKDAARALRAWPPLNRAATGIARRASRGAPSASMVEHLPRTGVVTVDLPGGEAIRLWSRGDDWISSRLWWLGVDGFEPEMVRPFLRFATTARTVVDIGAYTGYYAIAAAAVNPQARVFAFEPHPAIAARLGNNLTLNEDLRVTVVPSAVGATRGPAMFHVAGEGLPSSSSLAPAWEGAHHSELVGVVDLESFCADWGVDDLDLVKMDVETAEPDVVRGMGAVLDQQRPVIFTEVLPGADDAYDEMSARLAALDYRFFHLTSDGAVAEDRLTPPATYVDHLTTMVNHLACPRDKVPEWLPR